MKRFLAFLACFYMGMLQPQAASFKTNPAEIAMAAFRTFDGLPLPALLAAHGIQISSATPTMVSSIPASARHPGDERGDIIWDVELASDQPRLPCGLEASFSSLDSHRKPVTGRGVAIFEVTQRQANMPANPSDLRDPLVYWLAKGKCLE